MHTLKASESMKDQKLLAAPQNIGHMFPGMPRFGSLGELGAYLDECQTGNVFPQCILTFR